MGQVGLTRSLQLTSYLVMCIGKCQWRVYSSFSTTYKTLPYTGTRADNQLAPQHNSLLGMAPGNINGPAANMLRTFNLRLHQWGTIRHSFTIGYDFYFRNHEVKGRLLRRAKVQSTTVVVVTVICIMRSQLIRKFSILKLVHCDR